MAGNLIDLRKRLRSVQNTQKITQAMKTISAAKLRRATGELKKNQPFMDAIRTLLFRIGRHVDLSRLPLFRIRETGRSLLVVVSGDKGLCGAFNSHILRRAGQLIATAEEEQPLVITVGNKATRHFIKREIAPLHAYRGLMSRLSYTDARALSSQLQALFLEEEITSVDFVVTRFHSASRQEVDVQRLLPLPRELEADLEDGDREYIFEPDPDRLFEMLLPRYVDASVYRILRESEASEQAARMVAMELATRNANDMIRRLTLTMNKVRQAAITGELLEIITATEALRRR